MAIDPVCGMEVDEKTAAGQSEYQGETYYFCWAGCKEAFDQTPEKYLRPSGQDSDDHSKHEHHH